MVVLFMLLQNKQSEFCAPLTSFDWNDVDPKRLGTSSIDTTCTIWVRLSGGTVGSCTVVFASSAVLAADQCSIV
jgi:hypothetical protein